MLQYLINTSIIWLAGWLLYEVLFRRERFHQYNRVYLLGFLVAGLLLPAISFNKPASTPAFFSRPTEKVYHINESIATKPTPARELPVMQSSIQIADILWIIYLAGLLVAILLIARETRSLHRLYQNGKKQKEGRYTIVETGKGHGPFSFFNLVFISSRQNYTAAQWTLLLNHEREHSRKWHSADKIGLIILRSFFWFHPLPHIYYKRLMMVHEYEADRAAGDDIIAYGRFLLEQNMLQQVPFLTHTLYYSPIKKRIAMLTNTTSTRTRLLKYLAVFPLFLLLVLFCTKTSFSEPTVVKENKIRFKDNEIQFGGIRVIPYQYLQTIEQQKALFMCPTLPDSVLVKDLVHGVMKMERITSDTMPVALNGKPIYGNEPMYFLPASETRYAPPVLNNEAGSLEQYLFSQLKSELNQLEDGGYQIRVNRLVIDDQGRIAYYEPEGISMYAHPIDRENMVIKDELKKSINSKLAETLDKSPLFYPALRDGQPVNVRLTLGRYDIIVKNHKAQLVERTGC